MGIPATPTPAERAATLADARAIVDAVTNDEDENVDMRTFRLAQDLLAANEVLERIVEVADENFGPCPVQPADDAVTEIERGAFRERQLLQSTRAALEQACDALETEGLDETADRLRRLDLEGT